MRNLMQYPITKGEIVQILDETIKSYNPDLIGDIRPYAISRLRKFVLETMPDAFYENRSEEHTSELQSLMRISYAVFCLKKQKIILKSKQTTHIRYTHQL